MSEIVQVIRILQLKSWGHGFEYHLPDKKIKKKIDINDFESKGNTFSNFGDINDLKQGKYVPNPNFILFYILIF